jgi:hypothetical protein
MWKSMVEPDKPQVKVHDAQETWFACHITKQEYRHTHNI